MIGHRFDCASCTSAVDPEGLHRIHRCYCCGRLRWRPSHWFRRGIYLKWWER